MAIEVIGRGWNKAYYSQHRPTESSPCLPIGIKGLLRGITPKTLDGHLQKALQMQPRGETYDSHPLVNMIREFPLQDKCILASSNAMVFYNMNMDWGRVQAARDPSCVVQCPPEFFFDTEIPYAINAWMECGGPVSRELAQLQWKNLNQMLKSIIAVDTITPQKDWPDMTFVDQGLAIPSLSGDENVFIPGLMRNDERCGEAVFVRDFFAERGYTVRNLPYTRGHRTNEGEAYFESNGDVHIIPGKAALIVGSGKRSTANVAPALAEITGYKIFPVNLTISSEEPVYHLDTVASVIKKDIIMLYPQGMNAASLALLLMVFKNTYFIGKQELRDEFLPNSKAIRGHMFTQTSVSEGFLSFCQSVLGKDYVHQFPMSELNASGGGINCCSKLAFHVPPTDGKPEGA